MVSITASAAATDITVNIDTGTSVTLRDADSNGYYEISNGGQLFWFGNYINTVDRTANAVLTADIDLDGDGYLDVIDAYLLHLFINGFTTVDVYAVGDYDLNGVAFEEADIKAIKHAIENHWFSIVFGRSEETRRATPYDSLRENPIVFGFAESRGDILTACLLRCPKL